MRDYTIWDSLVWCSAFVLFTQMIVNGMLHFKFYWVMNLFILIAIWHLVAVRFSGADITKGFDKESEKNEITKALKYLCGTTMSDGNRNFYVCSKKKGHRGSHQATDSNNNVLAIWGEK